MRSFSSVMMVGATVGFMACGEADMTNTQFLDVPGGRVAFDDTGDNGTGLAVVCVPGIGDLRAQYRVLRPQLLAAGFRVVTLDLRGMGASSVQWDDYTAAGVGSDTVALIRHLALTDVALVGNSMGAAAVVWAAAETQSRVHSLTLVGPFVWNAPSNPVMEVLIQAAMLNPWGPFAWDQVYRSLYKTGSPPPDHDQHVRNIRRNLQEPGRMAAFRKTMGGSKAEAEKRIGQVHAPVLVVMGSKDPDFTDPKTHAQEVAQRLHGTVLMVEGAGHYPHVESAQQTGPAVVGFLQQATRN